MGKKDFDVNGPFFAQNILSWMEVERPKKWSMENFYLKKIKTYVSNTFIQIDLYKDLCVCTSQNFFTCKLKKKS